MDEKKSITEPTPCCLSEPPTYLSAFSFYLSKMVVNSDPRNKKQE